MDRKQSGATVEKKGSLGASSLIEKTIKVERTESDNTDDNIQEEDNDIKEFAETAMNELLGWYGYANTGSSIPRSSIDYLKKLRNKNGKRLPLNPSTITRNNSNSGSESDSPKSPESCGWCGKCVEDITAISSGSATFCSELCFSQSRRANFKKNKTCDWCKHVRHTISYVDFQDGASQLQFCSDKCLNQYKMQIFCRETRAHLEMHPHLVVQPILSGEDSTAALITPDLWLRNCKTPESRSNSPATQTSDPQTSPMPLITVAPPSKLLASPLSDQAAGKSRPKNKRLRKKAPLNSLNSSNSNKQELPQDLRVRPQSPHRPPHSSLPVQNTNQSFQNFPNVSNNFRTSLSQSNPLLPPVTIMVPYPVMIPVPIPIPIPLPISSFLQAAELKLKSSQQKSDESSSPCANGGTENVGATNGEAISDDDEEDEEIIVDDVKEKEFESKNEKEILSNGNKRKRAQHNFQDAERTCKIFIAKSSSNKKQPLSV